jgi:cyclomaltodextrinase
MVSAAAPTMLYHLYPLGSLDADQSGSDRRCAATLRDLIGWLPHLESLGADALLLGPVFESLSHGYDTVTHREIDTRIGTLDDLDALIAAAAERGVGVVLDGVFAFASRAFHRLTDDDEARAPWFRRDSAGRLVPWRVDTLVTPEYAAPGYRTYVADTITYWLDRGIAGFRLDSAYAVPDDFWHTVLDRVRRTHPTAWFLAQILDADLLSATAATTASSVTDYALMHAVRAWLCGGPVEAMIATLQTHATGARPHTFLGNHDHARLADAVPEPTLPLAFALLMTLPGIPGIYYGDEIALTSAWTQGCDDALLRPPLTADDVESGGRSPELLAEARRLASFRRANPWLRTAELVDIKATDGVLAYTVRDTAGDAVRVEINPSAAPQGRLAAHSWRLHGI